MFFASTIGIRKAGKRRKGLVLFLSSFPSGRAVVKMVVLKATLVQYAASFLGLFLSLPFGVGVGRAQLDNSIPIILEMTMIHPFFLPQVSFYLLPRCQECC